MSRGDRDGWNGSWSRPGIITSIMAMIRRCICETLEWCSHFGIGCSEPTAIQSSSRRIFDSGSASRLVRFGWRSAYESELSGCLLHEMRFYASRDTTGPILSDDPSRDTVVDQSPPLTVSRRNSCWVSSSSSSPSPARNDPYNSVICSTSRTSLPSAEAK